MIHHTKPLFVLEQLFALSLSDIFLTAFVFCVVCTACEHQSGWGTRTMGHQQAYRAWELP